MSDDITHSDLVTADGKRIRFASRIGGKSEAGLRVAEGINQQLRDQLTTKDRQIAELQRLCDDLSRQKRGARKQNALSVGRYDIYPHPAGGICMQIAEGHEGAGEGMQAHEDDFLRLIEGFYLEEF